MKIATIKTLTNSFEEYSQKTDSGVEFWLARELQQLLGYSEWRNFTQVISKAKTACELSGQTVSNHFVDVNKKVSLGSDAITEISDIMLTRYACYLIAQNGNSQKEEIAFGDDDDLDDEFPFLGPNPFIRRSPASPFMFREKLRRGYPFPGQRETGFSMGGGFSGVIEILQIMIAAQKARAAADAAAAKKPAQPDTDAPAVEEHGDQPNG